MTTTIRTLHLLCTAVPVPDKTAKQGQHIPFLGDTISDYTALCSSCMTVSYSAAINLDSYLAMSAG